VASSHHVSLAEMSERLNAPTFSCDWQQSMPWEEEDGGHSSGADIAVEQPKINSDALSFLRGELAQRISSARVQNLAYWGCEQCKEPRPVKAVTGTAAQTVSGTSRLLAGLGLDYAVAACRHTCAKTAWHLRQENPERLHELPWHTFDQLRILKVSNGLECLTAAAQSKHFVKYVENCSDFTAWIQRHMNVRMHAAMNRETCSGSVSEESFAPTSFEIKLRPRYLWSHSHFSAVCTLQSADSNDILNNTDLEPHLAAMHRSSTIRW